MQLDEALSKAAARGMTLTVTEYTFVQDGYAEADVEDVYAAAAQTPAAAATTPGAAAPALANTAQIDELQRKLTDAEGRAHSAAGQVADLQKQLQDIAAAGSTAQPMQKDALARIAELETQLASAGAANGNGAAGAGTDTAPLAAFESYNQSVLGLSEKAQKGVSRVGAITVGDVKTALLTGKLGGKDKGDGKLGRLEVIEVANKLLGQVPADASSVAVLSAGGGGGMAGVPTGITINSWSDLLGSARRKEAAAVGEREKIEQARSALQGLKAQQLTPDIQKQIEQWNALHVNADKMFALYEAQVSQFLYTLGLPYILKEVRTINGSLEKAGLVHLVNEVPAPQAAPTS